MDEAAPTQSQSEENARQTVTCSRCGATSTLPELFKFGSIAQHRSGLMCPPCYEERRAFYQKRFVEAMCAIILIGVLLWSRNLVQVAFIPISVAVGFFFTILLTPLHEFAHALTAVALNLRVYSIEIGWFGKRLVQFYVGRCSFEVKRLPLGGMTYVAHPSPNWIRTKEFLVVAAGPLLHCVLLYLTWHVIDSTDYADWTPEWVTWLLVAFALANAFEIVLNLWPKRYRSAIGDLPNDGLALLKLPFMTQEEIDLYHLAYFYYECLARLRQDDHAGATAYCAEGLKKFPDNVSLKWCQAAIALDQDRWDDARRIFEEARALPQMTPEGNALLLTSIAWADLISWVPTELGQADDYSRQAIDALPWRPEVKGTRGSVLVASGLVEPGMHLLRQALAENEETENRALNAAFLALGSARLGNMDEALIFLKRAERLDPRCRQLEHIRQEVGRLTHEPAQN